MELNQNAADLCEQMIRSADRLRVAVQRYACGTRVIDCGVHAPGGLEAGRLLAEACLAGLGEVQFFASSSEAWHMPGVMVRTDHPAAACMASQYAGWRVSVEGYSAMGSGPMRALAGKETLFDKIGRGGRESLAVGILEANQLPTPEVCQYLARECQLEPEALTLLVAPVTSQAGTVQVVARSVEMALHKLSELGFDLSQVESGFGTAPLPPVAVDPLAAMGRTNDAILYGAEVTLWLHGDEKRIGNLGAQVPSNASRAHGTPFAEIFRRHNRDFYSIDPNLFGPAVISFFNLDTGRSLRFGRALPDIIQASFATHR
jgi:methenyltetrahydromethanopterin cyclohydrolase